MDQPDKSERLIMEYLLGDLGPEDRKRVEESIFTDDAFFENVELIEEDLTTRYLDGTLSEHDRAGFERQFLATPRGYEDLRFSRAMQRYIAEHREPAAAARAAQLTAGAGRPRTSLLYALGSMRSIRNLAVAAGVVLVACAVWIVWTVSTRHQAGGIIVATLRPGALRGGGERAKVVIGGGVGTVQLHLQLDGNASQRYRAVLQTDDGADILSLNEVPTESTAGYDQAIVSVPAMLLKPGDYQVQLLGSTGIEFEEVDRYYFRVLRQ